MKIAAEPLRWALKACPRCAGDLYRATYSREYSCLACGELVAVDRDPDAPTVGDWMRAQFEREALFNASAT